VTHLLYLHGFRSSPESMKAQKMKAAVAQHHPEVAFWCPQLPPSPREAMALVAQGLEDRLRSDGPAPPSRLAVMGSSLGGFYATWVAEHLAVAAHSPVVLINPAVDPAQDLSGFIGEQTHWHDPAQTFYFRPEYVDELRAQSGVVLTRPQRYQVWAATGDEVLDWRDMQARYQVCHDTGGLHIVPGSDHALSDFDQHLPHMLAHLFGPRL
jgi:hypothetical protein